MKRLLQLFAANHSGNVAITAAIVVPVLVGGVGIAMSHNQASTVQSDTQQALDAAVLAGVAVGLNATAEERTAAAQKAFEANTTRFTELASAGVKASFTVNGTQVAGQATAAVKNPFAGLIGRETMPVGVKATADRAKSDPICVLALNESEDQGFYMNGNAEFRAKNCSAAVNSIGNAAMWAVGRSSAAAKQFGVAGRSKGDNFTPPPVPGIERVSDPYANVPLPPIQPCRETNLRIQQEEDRTLGPGTYCGGIRIMAQARVTLLPGEYVMYGGPFWVQSDAVVTGDDVVIAFTGRGSTLYVWSGTTKLTSPKSGPWMNIQFMQDRLDKDLRNSWSSIMGNAVLEYDGVMYFPTSRIWVQGDATVRGTSPSYIMVADKVFVDGGSKVTLEQANKRNLPVKDAARFSYGAALIK